MAAAVAPALAPLMMSQGGAAEPRRSLAGSQSQHKEPVEEPAKRIPSRKQTPTPQEPSATATADVSIASVSLPAINTRAKKAPSLRSPRAGGPPAGYPTPFSQHENAPAESPMVSDAQRAGSHVHFQYAPYMLYPLASMPYGAGDPQSPHAGALSPLMGSPVSTPTAMMFPQTPFAGAHNPFYHHHPPHHHHHHHPSYHGDVPISPHASGAVSYFHPLFNNAFPFMGLQSLQSVPSAAPGQGHQRNASVSQPQPSHQPQGPGARPGSISAAAGAAAQAAAAAGGVGAAPGAWLHTQASHVGKAGSPGGFVFAQPMVSFTQSGNGSTQIDTNPVETESPDTMVADMGMLSGMFNALHVHGQHGAAPMPLLMGSMQDVMTLQQLAGMQHQAILAQQAAQLGGQGIAVPTYTTSEEPGSPSAVLYTHVAGQLAGTAGWPLGTMMPAVALSTSPGAAQGFESYDLSAMYNVGLMNQGLVPTMGAGTMQDLYAGGMYVPGMEMMGQGMQPTVQQGWQRRGRGNSQSPTKRDDGMSRFYVGGHGAGMVGGGQPVHARRPGPSPLGQSAAAAAAAAAAKGGGLPLGPRRGGGIAGLTLSTGGAAGGEPARVSLGGGSVGTPTGDVGGAPRLNARQRRTLRRARERVIKGLMEAGRLLLQRQVGSTEGAPTTAPTSVASVAGGDASSSPTSTVTPTGTKDGAGPLDNADTGDAKGGEGSPGSAGQGNAQLAATNLYFQAAMQVAAGSHGPEAAENANNVLNQVAADLEDSNIAELISLLSKEEGGVDESLIRDLQIIQNLLGAMRGGSSCSNASTSPAGVTSPAGLLVAPIVTPGAPATLAQVVTTSAGGAPVLAPIRLTPAAVKPQ